MKSEVAEKEWIEKHPLEDIERFIYEAGSDHLGTFGGQFEGGIQLQQIADETGPCIKYILDIMEPIRNYLEIGSAAGGTVALLNHFFQFENIVLIDDNQHPKAHVRPYILRDIKYTEIIGHSQAEGTIAQLRRQDLIFDLIMLDGNHTYPGVRADAHNFLPFLRPGGFMIMHDSALPEWGIKDVVRELKDDARVEFVNEWLSKRHVRPLGVTLFRKVPDENQ